MQCEPHSVEHRNQLTVVSNMEVYQRPCPNEHSMTPAVKKNLLALLTWPWTKSCTTLKPWLGFLNVLISVGVCSTLRATHEV